MKKSIWEIICESTPINAIMSIFDNDESKIISDLGKSYLSDKNKMDEINKKIKDIQESDNPHQDIYI